MSQKGKNVSGSGQMAVTIAVGTVAAVLVELLALTAVAALITAGRLGEGAILRGCCTGLFLGCLIGGCYAARRVRRRMLPLGLGMAGLNLLCWAAAGLLWGGQVSFSAVGTLLLPALAGGALAGVLGAQIWRRG